METSLFITATNKVLETGGQTVKTNANRQTVKTLTGLETRTKQVRPPEFDRLTYMVEREN